MSEIKAIETQYKGYRFRSRLEARWAVFFDALGIEWEYEKEGYDLGEAGWYLPDFWLPSASMFTEIKPFDLPKEELSHLTSIAYAMTQIAPFMTLFGPPDCQRHYPLMVPDGTGRVKIVPCQLWFDDKQRSLLLVVPREQFTDKALEGIGSTHVAVNARTRALAAIDTNLERSKQLKMFNAIRAARSARFEHGESGAK